MDEYVRHFSINAYKRVCLHLNYCLHSVFIEPNLSLWKYYVL